MITLKRKQDIIFLSNYDAVLYQCIRVKVNKGMS
jgi:hypothetical protein